MSRKVLTNIDMNLNQLLNALAQVLATDPGSPSQAGFWFNSTTPSFRYYDGTSVQILRGSASASTPNTEVLRDGSGNFAANVITVVSMTISGAPTNPTDAVTKGYVDAAIQGMAVKPSANYATTAVLPANTYANGVAGVGATLTGNSNGALSAQDGQTPAAGDVILVKNEATASRNGLYTVTTLGTGGAPYVLTRHIDMDVSAEFGGALIAVEFGTINSGSLWLCTTNLPIIGTTSIAFTELNKATDLQPGTGISITGNTISISATYVGQASITTLGTIATGIWNGTAIPIANGGTGQVTALAAFDSLSPLTTTGDVIVFSGGHNIRLPQGANGTFLGVSGGAFGYYTPAGGGSVSKYSTLIGDGSSTAITITQATHGLPANQQLMVRIEDATTGAEVIVDNTISAGGNVTLTFAIAPASNAYRVVLMG